MAITLRPILSRQESLWSEWSIWVVSMHGSLAERAVRLMDQLLARINQYNKSLALSCLNNTIDKLGHMFLLKKTQTDGCWEDRAPV